MKNIRLEESIVEGQDSLTVRVDVGEVKIQVHALPTVVLEAAFTQMDVTMTRQGNELVVRAAAPFDMWTWLNRPGSAPKLTMTLWVPAGCPLKARLATGKLAIDGLLAPVDAQVLTGTAQLANLGGAVQAQVVTGRLHYQGLLVDDTHRFRVTTGSLKLQLSKEPNAQLLAKTATGRVQVDFPLQQRQLVSRNLVGQKLSGQLGSGAGQLQLRVVTGSIHIGQWTSSKDAATAPAMAAAA